MAFQYTYTPNQKISDIFNSLKPATRTLPNAGGTYQTVTSGTPDGPAYSGPVQGPVFSGSAPTPPPAPPVRSIAPPRPAPILPASGVASPPPAVQQPPAPVIPPQYIDPQTGQMYTQDAYNQMISQKASGGTVPNYAGNALTQGPQTTQELQATATDLNNQRNDIATGTTDPYNVASKSGIAYSPTELAAIEKAYAGIYDPALKDVFSKLDIKQKQDAADLANKTKLSDAATAQKNAIELKQTPTYAESHPADPNSSTNQDKLEQQYRQILLKPLSNRSGGLGLEDAKVNQAIHLAALINQYKDSTGNYNIPATQYNELALGLARLISPTGTVGSEVQNSITQSTAKGDFNKALSFVTGTPFNGSTQAVYKNLIDTIDRQGQTAQQNRDQYMTYLQGLVPTDLDPTRESALEQHLLNQYSPINSSGSTVTAPASSPFAAPDGTLVQITD